MHKFLQMQNISYTIFIVNQVDDKKFNRAGLFNVGFYEAQKMNNSHDCYFFHDVDLIPDNGNLTYCCSSDAVLHYATAIWRHSAPGEIKDYSMFFGGIVAATASQFQKANGFSNRYWGWGGEDDDFLKRVHASGQKASNIPFADGRYVMFKHDRDKGNEPNGLRMKLLGETQKTWKSDGLNTLNYTVLSILKKKYYTEIQVSF
uniref:Uncharacterized protein n=1 Tax=Plectus sambesii TaxID=2011161 RepID=A0A914WMS4_9BILA